MYCYLATFLRSPRHVSGIYLTVRRAMLLPVSRIFSHLVIKCFHFSTAFGFVATKTFLQCFKQMTVALWRIPRYDHYQCRVFSYEITRHVILLAQRPSYVCVCVCVWLMFVGQKHVWNWYAITRTSVSCTMMIVYVIIPDNGLNSFQLSNQEPFQNLFLSKGYSEFNFCLLCCCCILNLK
jgi:hypothetical protein